MATSTLSTSDSIRAILEYGVQVADDSSREIPADALKVGTTLAQGDINITVLAKVPSKCVKAEPDRQLAPGTSRGSRHCIAADDMHKVRFYKFQSPNAIQGPVLEFTDSVTVEHPEHGNQTLPAGIYGITYQVDYATELRRIQD